MLTIRWGQIMVAKKKNKFWISTGSILGILILFLAFGAIFLSTRWKPFLTEKIKASIYTGSNHLYTINFKRLNLNIITASLALHDVKIIPDSMVFFSLKASRSSPAHTFEISLKKLQITRIGILTAYFKKHINVGEIILDRPSVNMTFNKVPKKIDPKQKEKSLYEHISETFKSIHVNKIRLVDADFDYINKSGLKQTKNSIKHLDVSIKDFLLDSISEQDTTRFYYTKDVSFQIAGYRSITKDKMYSIKVDTISGSTASKNATIKGLKLMPLYSELDFARKYKVQKDRYNLDFKRIEFKGVDFVGFNTDQKLQAKSLYIGPAEVEVFMSRESPPSPGFDKGQNYPHLALRRLGIQTLFDTVKLRKVNVKYAEYNPASKKIGSVEFKSLTGNILNVTNDSLQLSRNNYAVANLNTLLMGTGKLNIKISFNLTDKNWAFSYSGNLDRFNLQSLNPLSKALGLIEIESGSIQQVDFTVNGNLRKATGSINMIYNNLKVKLLSDNIDGRGTKEKGFLSFLANSILVKNENPKGGEAPRTASMTNTRINSASFFNLMWKTVFVGIKDIVGVGVIPEKDPVKQQKIIAKKIKKIADKREAKTVNRNKN